MPQVFSRNFLDKKAHKASFFALMEEEIIVSPHVINLKPTQPAAKPAAVKNTNPYLGRWSWFWKMLDQPLYLKDLNTRTLSVRPRGWRDFPPAEATTIQQALAITAQRFVDESPLANLTIVSVLHLAFLIVTYPITKATAPKKTIEQKIAEELIPREPALSWLWAMPTFQFAFVRERGWATGLMSFAFVATLIALPLGTYGSLRNDGLSVQGVITTGTDGASNLMNAIDFAKRGEFERATDEFSAAQEKFETVTNAIGYFGRAVSYAASVLPASTSLAAAAPLVDAGREISTAGTIISSALERLRFADVPVSAKIDLLTSAIDTAEPYLNRAAEAMSRVPTESVPEEFRPQVEKAKELLPQAIAELRSNRPVLDLLAVAIGADEPRRYLVLFQNDAELRATGGFIGSYALLDVRDGKIIAMDIPSGGSYSLQGQQTLKLVSPQPLHLINPTWEFQDANWYPDFATSAQMAVRLYERAGGPTPDGVIAINASVMEKLLAVLGPIDMEKYGKTVDAENFRHETQLAVEVEYDREENKPKQFVADMAPQVIERVMNADISSLIGIAKTIVGSIGARDIQFWSRNAEEQSLIAERGWDGSLSTVAGDYLNIVHTNVNGQKTDTVMRDEVKHAAKLMSDGTAIVTLTITRYHDGIKGDLFTGVRNVDYVRVYVPKGSRIVEAKGFNPPAPSLFEIADRQFEVEPRLANEEGNATIDRASGTRAYEESGKTVFGNWLQVDPGESATAEITYRLPPGIVTYTTGDVIGGTEGETSETKPTLNYDLTVQKQSGLKPFAFTSVIALPSGWFPVVATPTRLDINERGLVSETTVDADKSFSLVAESHQP